jgi:hypothetical protein
MKTVCTLLGVGAALVWGGCYTQFYSTYDEQTVPPTQSPEPIVIYMPAPYPWPAPPVDYLPAPPGPGRTPAAGSVSEPQRREIGSTRSTPSATTPSQPPAQRRPAQR